MFSKNIQVRLYYHIVYTTVSLIHTVPRRLKTPLTAGGKILKGNFIKIKEFH